jgi:hypothetical protein
MEVVVALFMAVMGVAMAGIWTLDIRASRGFEAPSGLLRAREAGTGSLMVWHWSAEFGTAATLVVAALALLVEAAIAVPIALVGLGALAYTSCNSLAWALARPERRAYGVPMLVGLVGAIVAVILLLVV